MKLLLVVAVLALPAFAQERAPSSADAPVLEQPTPPVVFPAGPLAPGKSTRVKAGELAPYSGQLLDDQELVRRARITARDAAELQELKKGNAVISTPAFIAIVAGCVVAGAAAGAAVAYAVKR